MKRPKGTRDNYFVEAAASALDILDSFREAEELSLTQISDRVGLNKTRVFRLLHTLLLRGYVDKSPDGARYSLGVKLLARAACVRGDLRQIALPFMRQLQERFNETVNLGVLDNGEILYIEILESSHPFRMAARVGSRGPIGSTALGRAMAAFLPESYLKELLRSHRQSKLTDRTITDPGKLRRELQRVRQKGYAIDDRENLPGAACVGSPLFDSTGKPIAAMSLSGPVDRILGNGTQEMTVSLVAVCKEISRKIGFREENSRALGRTEEGNSPRASAKGETSKRGI